jgi:hypothetical protein
MGLNGVVKRQRRNFWPQNTPSLTEAFGLMWLERVNLPVHGSIRVERAKSNHHPHEQKSLTSSRARWDAAQGWAEGS